MATRKEDEIEKTSAMEINNAIRRTLVVLKIDPNSVRYTTANGVISLTGTIKFVGKNVAPEEMPRELKKIEERLLMLKGARSVKVDLDTFSKNEKGDFSMSGQYKAQLMKAEREKIERIRGGGGGKKVVSKNAPICSNTKCHQTINFCPHCGDPLDLKLLIKAAEKLMKKGFSSATGDDLEKEMTNPSWDLAKMKEDYASQEQEEDPEEAERRAMENSGKVKGAVEYRLGQDNSPVEEEENEGKSKIKEILQKQKEADQLARKKRSQNDELGSIDWNKIPGMDP